MADLDRSLPFDNSDTGQDTTTEVTLDKAIERHVLLVMRAAGGNKTHAARVLGVNRRTIYRLLTKYGIVS